MDRDMNNQPSTFPRLQFLFTEGSFLVDRPGTEVAEADRELKQMK